MNTTTSLEHRFQQLIDRDEKPTLTELSALYDDAEPILTAEILGEWAGGTFGLGHPIEAQLASMRWAGKSFASAEEVAPIVCLDEQGRRYANTTFGGARLSDVEYRGSRTATMSYENLPICDHFRRVSDTIVMGAMEVQGATETGYFYLTRLEGEGAPAGPGASGSQSNVG